MRSIKLGMATFSLLMGTALFLPAQASGDDESCQNNSCNTNVAHGGEGGQGGMGGEGGTGVGYGGEANATARAVNNNVNAAHGGNATNRNNIDNSNANSQGQDQGQDQAQSVENVGNVHIENQRPPVSTAYAAHLTTGEDTCMGSSSIGAQAVTFGLSLGTTWQDDNCRRLKNSRQLVALGFHRAATALMCVDEDVRAAMIAAGTPCPNGEMAAAVAAPPARHYVMMAPVADKPAKGKKQRKQRKPLPPK